MVFEIANRSPGIYPVVGVRSGCGSPARVVNGVTGPSAASMVRKTCEMLELSTHHQGNETEFGGHEEGVRIFRQPGKMERALG
jgi:hypothetical protein